jgi:hypothetical protein
MVEKWWFAAKQIDSKLAISSILGFMFLSMEPK